jgi:hypothetical protein
MRRVEGGLGHEAPLRSSPLELEPPCPCGTGPGACPPDMAESGTSRSSSAGAGSAKQTSFPPEMAHSQRGAGPCGTGPGVCPRDMAPRDLVAILAAAADVLLGVSTKDSKRDNLPCQEANGAGRSHK